MLWWETHWWGRKREGKGRAGGSEKREDKWKTEGLTLKSIKYCKDGGGQMQLNMNIFFPLVSQDLWVLTTQPVLRLPSRPWMAFRSEWRDWRCSSKGPKMPTVRTEWRLRGGGRRTKERWGGGEEVMSNMTWKEVRCCKVGRQENEIWRRKRRGGRR